MLQRMWSKENTPPLLMEVRSLTATLEINMAVSQKIGNQSISKPSYSTLGHIYKGCLILAQGHLINYVHSIFTFNNQNLETA